MSLRGPKTFRKVVTTAGTRVRLVAASTKVRKVKIKALVGNTGVMYIGDSTVASTNGFQLAAGAEIFLNDLFWNEYDIVDLYELYLDSAVNGEGVSVIYAD